ncbi:hypothetical protein PAXRUDRAFT_115564, partial [Paxillus rubicundulus Ve08.2h10]
PWEWMHVFLENIIPALIKLWTGQFKGLDTRHEDYGIVPHIWAEVGEETISAVQDIPAACVHILGNIAKDGGRLMFTAEAWGFWFMYLAPIMLK